MKDDTIGSLLRALKIRKAPAIDTTPAAAPISISAVTPLVVAITPEHPPSTFTDGTELPEAVPVPPVTVVSPVFESLIQRPWLAALGAGTVTPEKRARLTDTERDQMVRWIDEGPRGIDSVAQRLRTSVRRGEQIREHRAALETAVLDRPDRLDMVFADLGMDEAPLVSAESELELLLAQGARANSDGLLSSLLEHAARALSASAGKNLAENFDRVLGQFELALGERVSPLFGAVHNRGAATLLLERLGALCRDNRDSVLTERVIEQLIVANLLARDTADTQHGFGLRPDALTHPAFVYHLGSWGGGPIQGRAATFCRSSDLSDFARQVAEANGSLDFAGVSAERLVPEALQQQHRPLPVAPGLFVDVEGTLIRRDGSADRLIEDQELAVRMLSYLGVPVTTMSGDDPSNVKRRMAAAGVDPALRHVCSKSSLHGKMLQAVIDDRPPIGQGFGAKIYVARGFDLAAAW